MISGPVSPAALVPVDAVPEIVPPEGDIPDGAANELPLPKSQFTLTAIFNIWPEEVVLMDLQKKYENMSNEVRQMFIDFRIPRSNRYIKSCRYQAEICPKTRNCHIQVWLWTNNKKPTPIEILHFLEKKDRHAIKVIHPNDPHAAALYCNKENSRMPGAEPQGWGDLPPMGQYPKQGGSRANAGKNAVSLEEYHEMVVLSRQPQRCFLESKFGRRLKTKEVWDMINARPKVIFKGVNARKYVSINWCRKGNLGKSTLPYLWAEMAGEEICKAPTAERGMYGRWLDGFDFQRCLLLNEFNGNWIHGFHDFLDFLDAMYTRLMEVKRFWVNTDFEFIFINSNYNPRTEWIWFFPEEQHDRETKGYRVLTDEEWELFVRRLCWGAWAGCGLAEWDPSIPKERSREQPFIYDLWFIRMMEAGAEGPPPRAHAAFPDVPGPVIPVIPQAAAPRVWPVPPPEAEEGPPRRRRRLHYDPDGGDIFDLLKHLADEDQQAENRWALSHVANIPEPEDVTDEAALQARLATEDDEASELGAPVAHFFDAEAASVDELAPPDPEEISEAF